MLNFTIRSQELEQTLDTLPKEVARLTILKLSTAVFTEAKNQGKPHKKTGAMENSLVNLRKGTNGREVRIGGPNAGHAIFVHFGTKPHVIKPKPDSQRQALRFSGPNGAIFAKFVNHPGYKGDAFMYRAANTVTKSLFNKIVNTAFNEAGNP